MIVVRWGSYKDFEGPWFPGTRSFQLPGAPTFEEEVLAVITATEGGHWDAINRYDSCIDTQGLIQWCNRAPQHSVDALYGELQQADPSLLAPAEALFKEHGYVFSDRRWRGPAGVVDTPAEQQVLYFSGASGRKGSWDEAAKTYAQRAVAAAVEIWQSPQAQKIQGAWTIKRLSWFLVGALTKRLFDLAPDTPVGRAFKAMYWSFAANNPKKASEALEEFVESPTGAYSMWSPGWLSSCAYYLTFFPKITIYPDRYNKIRPVIEKLYEVDLPDYAQELKKWKSEHRIQSFLDPLELQRALKALGYDLGPRGVDGVLGTKTQAALHDFEKDMGVKEPDGLIDPETAKLLEKALERRGIQSLA